ncbi:uncharacterized protein LOC121254353 [Juglans microcarpa x Juglans regia]|uniref:uncharacterized protein LOC121254353 n=1 Tax=Juglans microcarpa x Juglans regia TaxID=2249226 RepID=UPI001B7DF5BA|nr:uncharacterized protein LOC121254353 [Juglans microcarpa x Juglans regia]
MEEEELARRWENLKLSSEESKIFLVSPADMKDSVLRGTFCVVGGVMADRGINSEAFRVTISQVWRLEGWVKFKDIGDLRFLIEFQLLSDKEKVLGGRPWFFNRNLVSLQEIDETIPLNSVKFQFEPFWVQLHGLPLAAMSEEIGENLASSIGHVLHVEADSDGMAWGKCMRVRVAVDLYKPLLRGKWVQLDEQKYWVSLKYERLQSFCFHCGILAHKLKGCQGQKGVTVGDQSKTSQFGPWLRAQPMNTKIFETRKYGGTIGDYYQQRRYKNEAPGNFDYENNEGKSSESTPFVANPPVSEMQTDSPGSDFKVQGGEEIKFQFGSEPLNSGQVSTSQRSTPVCEKSKVKTVCSAPKLPFAKKGAKKKRITWKRRARGEHLHRSLVRESESKEKRKKRVDSNSGVVEPDKKKRDMKGFNLDTELVEAAVQLHQQQ